jgi:hypothetical protein
MTSPFPSDRTALHLDKDTDKRARSIAVVLQTTPEAVVNAAVWLLNFGLQSQSAQPYEHILPKLGKPRGPEALRDIVRRMARRTRTTKKGQR